MKILALLFCASLIPACCASNVSTRDSLFDFSDIVEWPGLLPDPSVKFETEPAAKWDCAKSPSVQTSKLPHDWSASNALEIALQMDKAARSKLVITMISNSASTQGEDKLGIRIPIEGSGWRKLVIPFNEFTRYGTPAGWGKIDSLRLSIEGVPHSECFLYISGLRLAHIATPSISDSELLDMLDLDCPGMEQVKSAAKSGDIAAAKHEFARYLRSRKKPVWYFDPHSRPKHASRPEGVNTTEADRILQRDLPSVFVYHKFQGQIDWNLDPMNYCEWPWQLNRHPFWAVLGKAYWDTGDEKYAKEFVYQMTDWVTRCSVPKYTSGNATGTWRTIEAGIRTSTSWFDSYYRFLSSESFTDDAIILMVKSFAEHARHLMRWPTGGNWLTMESDGLMHIGVMFPEFKEAANWRKTATDRLYTELDRQVYPDGAQIELTPNYHRGALQNFLKAWDIARINDIEMPEDYIARIERMYDYEMKALMPNGLLPGLNDSDNQDVRRDLGKAFGLFPSRKDYEWIATEGVKGQVPSFTSVSIPFAGHLVMRDGWRADDSYLLFDAGPFGASHQHEDMLSFVIFACGQYLLVDAGNYPYDTSQWRAYVLSTRAHNTVMVDNEDQHRRTAALRDSFVVSKPLPGKWVGAKEFDYASGCYSDGYGADNKIRVAHTRNIFFVKSQYWIVTDFLKPQDSARHSYSSMFHLNAETAKVEGSVKLVQTLDAGSANMVVAAVEDPGLSIRIVQGQEKPAVQGWKHGESYYEVVPVPTAIFEKAVSGPTGFGYALFPIAAGGKCPIERVEAVNVDAPAGVQTIGMAVRFAGGRVDYYVQADASGAKVRFLDFETDAQATYVRTENGRVVAALMAGGTALSRAEKTIPAQIAPVQDLSQTNARHIF